MAWLSLAAGVVGCAGHSWIESPSDAELPIEPPSRGYPTALDPAAIPIGAKNASPSAIPLTSSAGQASQVVDQAKTAAQTAEVAAKPEQRQRNVPPQLITPLAVVPPQYRTKPAAGPVSASLSDSEPPATQSASPAEPQAVTLSSPPVPEAPAQLPGIVSVTELAPALANLESAIGPSSISSGADVAVTVASAAIDVKPDVEKARRDLIAALEDEIRRRRDVSQNDEELPRLEQDLRLAYLAGGRLDDAVAEVTSLDESQRESYKQLMFGLGVWLSPDEARRAPLRTAKVLQSLREATNELSSGSKLELRKIAFCDRVESFGVFNEFTRNEFQPKQLVLLYVEVDNFAAERKSPTVFETELHGSYQIVDASGQIVAEKQLATDKETCRNHRRDYFLVYHITMPEAVAPGRYRLELTIEDHRAKGKYPGRKFGEGMIEFTIRQ